MYVCVYSSLNYSVGLVASYGHRLICWPCKSAQSVRLHLSVTGAGDRAANRAAAAPSDGGGQTGSNLVEGGQPQEGGQAEDREGGTWSRAKLATRTL